MNLQEFIDYRSHCPLCDIALITLFNFRKQNIKYQDNKATIIYDLSSLKKGVQSIKIGYVFGLKDNFIYIEFYNKDGKILNVIPLSYIKRFKDFDANISNNERFSFSRSCKFCKKYFLKTFYFAIDYKTQSISPLKIFKETFGFIIPTHNQFKTIILNNYFDPLKSNIKWWRSYNEDNVELEFFASKFYLTDISEIDLAFIPFISKEETIKRLDTLLIFS